MPTAALSLTSLFVKLRTKPNQEGILMRIDRSRLTPNLTGTYPCQTPLNYTTTDVFLHYYVFYSQTLTSGANRVHSPVVNSQLIGSLTITAYDAKRQLLSGKFSANIPDASDPTDTTTTPNPRRCNITLTGSFTNLPIAPLQ